MSLPAWLRPTFDQFKHQWQQQRLPHALLITGADGLGKFELATACAAQLLAVGSETVADQPDYLCIEPEKRTISINQIRASHDFVTSSAHAAGNKVIVIKRAESLNRAASNALLKTLEEPPAGVFFILTTASAKQLLATIQSRCQLLNCQPPSKQQLLDWLRAKGIDIGLFDKLPELLELPPSILLEQLETDVAVLPQLLQSLSNPTTLAANWPQLSAEWSKLEPLEFWQAVVIAITLLTRRLLAEKNLTSEQEQQLLGFWSSQQQVRYTYQRGIELNRQLAIEQLLLRWQQVFSY